MTKKDRKDYDYYTMNFPNRLRILFEAYLKKYPNLGFNNVSQFAQHILQLKAEEIIRENPELGEIKEFKIDKTTYFLKEDGTYKKVKE